ncbi:WVELL protein [Bhargavaea beijingensis]|uniref:WVELL protein n=1 Tax=Bhargavaea beijingensis TaxID=426756 RepID=A0A1G7BCK7_9BACL|nr:YfhJ family protein [Bhargavaea beijingensis]SDE24692.1 WVELL protein [Bhargavaea beijingensis]
MSPGLTEQLAIRLMEGNDQLSANRAKTWVELMASDIESSYAKAGYGMMDEEQVSQLVLRWIDAYGNRLDEFVASNPRIRELLGEDGTLH